MEMTEFKVLPVLLELDGNDGAQGPAGPAGIDGNDGAQGPAGPAGADGNDGVQGPVGPAGADGNDGVQGPVGPAGADGNDGVQGPVGPAGADGNDGAQGPVGPAGADGQDGVFSVTGTSGQTIRHNGTDWVANSFLFNNGTKLGVGSTSPGRRLEIEEDAQYTGLRLNNTSIGGSYWDILSNGNASVNSAALSFWNGSHRLLIDDNGNIGIGTTNPNTKLEIVSSSSPTLRINENNQAGYLELIGHADSQSQIIHFNGTTNESTMLDIDAVSTGGGAQTIRLFRNANSSGLGYFKIYNPGTTTENLRIDAATGNSYFGNSINNSGDINAYGGNINLYNDIVGNVGYSSLLLSLDNTTANATAEIRLARTSGTAYLGLEINSTSRDGIRFQTGQSTLNEVARIDQNGNFQLQNGTSINEFSTDGTLAGNSDDALPTEKAVKTYIDNNSGAGSIDDLSDGSDGLGTNNVFLGTNTGNSNDAGGGYNTGLGYNSLIDLTSGDHNTAVGYASQYEQIDGSYNTSVGSYSMIYGNNSNVGNTAFGYAAMRGASTAMFNNANYNNAIGFASLYSIVSGDNNNAFGTNALRSTTTGIGNDAFGQRALYSNVDGDYNVAMGYYAGYLGNGDKNVFIGYQAGYNETGSNTLYISNSSTATPLIKGDFSAKELELKAKTKIIRQDGANYIEFSADASGNYITSDDPAANQKPLYISANPSSSATKPIYLRTNNSARMTIHGDGNIGIGTGTSTPSAKLQVSGDVLIEDQLKYNYGTPSSGTPVTTGKVEKLIRVDPTSSQDLYEDDYLEIRYNSYRIQIKPKTASMVGDWGSSRLPFRDNEGSGTVYAWVGGSWGGSLSGSEDGKETTSSGNYTYVTNQDEMMYYGRNAANQYVISKEDNNSPVYKVTMQALTDDNGWIIIEAYYD